MMELGAGEGDASSSSTDVLCAREVLGNDSFSS